MGARFARHTFTYPRVPCHPIRPARYELSPRLTLPLPLPSPSPSVSSSTSRSRPSRHLRASRPRAYPSYPDPSPRHRHRPPFPLYPVPPAPWPLPPRRALAFGVSRAGFSRWARYRCVRRAPGLIYEAFAGTSRPRIIIKIPRLTSSTLPLHPLHSPCSSASSRSAAAAAVAPVAARRALTFRDITFHSELDQSFNGRKFNLCAATK